MKVNKKILSIPPYISTSWDFVTAIRMQATDLLVYLVHGEIVTIPNLRPDVLEGIFDHHALFLEEKENRTHKQPFKTLSKPLSIAPAAGSENNVESIFKIGIGNADGINTVMQHTPELANSPDLPREVIEKIGAISKIMAPEDMAIPEAEPHCNCPYCQIARALHNQPKTTEELDQPVEEEVVHEADLQFQEWEITPSGEKLFTVINKLDSQEKYSVYLGHPVGCTCGKQGCEHILAVLKS